TVVPACDYGSAAPRLVHALVRPRKWQRCTDSMALIVGHLSRPGGKAAAAAAALGRYKANLSSGPCRRDGRPVWATNVRCGPIGASGARSAGVSESASGGRVGPGNQAT